MVSRNLRKKIKGLNRWIKGLYIKGYNSPLRKGKYGDFIFIHLNKNGGTSISNAIGLPYVRHLNVKEIISMIGEDAFSQSFVFCVVRNPWDRVVSQYEFRLRTNQINKSDINSSFKEWVKDTYGGQNTFSNYKNPKLFYPQCDWLKDKNGVIRVENILKFESLHDDFEKITEKLGIKNDLPHLNVTRKKSYKNYYDKETEETVGKWFKEDIERFNYSFE